MVVGIQLFRGRLYLGSLLIVTLFVSGCAHHMPLPEEPFRWVYGSAFFSTKDENKSHNWAPVFVIYDHQRRYNRIGRPTVNLDTRNQERVYIDTGHPVIYYMEKTFKTQKAAYTNQIYRVHFPKVPYSLVPFHLTAGKNVGLLVVVTLNVERLPVLVTTVHTCGCYKAIIPTQYLPEEALPQQWPDRQLSVYGEKLPAMLQIRALTSPRLMIHLRPGVHRVMNIEMVDHQRLSSSMYHLIPMISAPMNQLDRLPVDGGTTSFYHKEGILAGHVKGSVKFLETLFLSLISLDLFVGSDKDYMDTAETNNPFYTSLKPWRRDDSNMWNFARFLDYWGWRL